MTDDAKLDDAVLTTTLLGLLEPPHIKALERIYQAQVAAKEADELRPRAKFAERELNPRITDAAQECHPQVLALLAAQSLIDSSAGFGDGEARVRGVTAYGEWLLGELRQPVDGEG
jgi:hypothetical protein